MKKCPKCKRTKRSELFSPTASMCKSCNRKYVKAQSMTAYGGLYVSCKQAIQRAKRTTGAYKHVNCEFPTPAAFRKAIWNDAEKRATWERMWQRYEESGFDDDLRPTIDRIDSDGSYTMSNIQFLPWGDHRIKDVKVHMLDLFYENKQGQQCVRRMTRKQAESEFTELKDIMQGGYGEGMLLQNASITVNPARRVQNRYPGMRREEIVAKIKARLEQSRKIIKDNA